MTVEEILESAHKFAGSSKNKSNDSAAQDQIKEFLRRFPYRQHPGTIQAITPQILYDKGNTDYFFNWVEKKTSNAGRIFTYGGKVFPNAVNDIETFKRLLAMIVSESESVADKIDSKWENILGFGGDKLIAKKILSLYFPEAIVPIFKTENLEYIAEKLGIFSASEDGFPPGYESFTVGKKFEMFTKKLMKFKTDNLKDWTNTLFGTFLYNEFPPSKVNHNQDKPKLKKMSDSSIGLLFEPQCEQEVVYLFSLKHSELGFPFLIRLQQGFPDVLAYDEDRQQVRIELELYASTFLQHKHEKSGCDFLVCWENDLTEDPPDFPEIIELKEFIKISP